MGPAARQMSRIGPWCRPAPEPIVIAMSERGLHRIEDDLNETWLEDWAGAGVAEIEAYLAKHAAFLALPRRRRRVEPPRGREP